jgi:hypothetical protein
MPLMSTKFQDFRILPFTDSPLDPILNEIDRLYGFGFFFAAISISLSLPDICSSLEISMDDTQGRFKTERRYIPWCETYLQHRFSTFNAVDCWALRGGVLHNGKLHGHPKAKYTRVIFLPPQSSFGHEISMANNGGSDDSALILDTKAFCHAMTAAVQEWYSAKKGELVVQENLLGLVRTRQQGLAPHIVGLPVIA